jgi:hypothetical protein
MWRTVLTIGLSVAISITSTVAYYHFTTVQVVTPPAACPEVAVPPAATQDLDTTYQPQGRLLPMPGTH